MLDTYSLQKDGWNPKGSVGGLPLFDVPLFLRATHTLELEVAVVGLWSDSLGLEDDKGNRSDAGSSVPGKALFFSGASYK